MRRQESERDEEYGLVILGSGSAAFAAAIKAAGLGVSVAIVERDTIGGTCVNVGCVPSKHLLTLAETFHRPTHNPFSAIRFDEGRLDFARAMQQKDEVVVSLRTAKYVDVLEGIPEVTYVEGSGVIEGPHEVRVDDRSLRAENILIATGSSPHIPPFKGIDQVDFLTSKEALALPDLPESMLVIGGRAVGLEFAQMYARLGTRVTLLQRSPSLLPEHEPEISLGIERYLSEEGIKIVTGASVKEVSTGDGTIRVAVSVNDAQKVYEGEKLLMATGRAPNTAGLGLEKAGVKTRPDGAVVVDEHLQTSVPSIWAAGDVIGQPMLETSAAKEGSIAARNAFSEEKVAYDPSAIPQAVFTDPQVARVGISEKQLMEELGVCACRVLEMDLVPKAQTVGDTRGLIKMIIDPNTDVVRGVQMVSPLAADMIHEATLAVKFGLTIHDIIDTVHVFPTMSEAIKLVAQSFLMDISKVSCCVG
jgi:mercuric reductase